MDVLEWGPCSWKTLFFVAAGYDTNKEPKNVKDQHYKNYFKETGHCIPCIFCRNSYQEFHDKLDIDKYIGKKYGLIRFVYDMKNLVNQKLKGQEDKLAKEILQKKPMSKCSPADLRKLSCIFYTKEAPPFMDVVKEYTKHYAKCSKKLKSCRKTKPSS